MAMIACPECTTEVSDAALKCPKCGVQLRIPQRSGFGKFAKWALIIFNVLMVLWMFQAFVISGQGLSEATSGAEEIGTGLGVMAGLGIISCVWVMGDIVLGLVVLLTRPKS